MVIKIGKFLACKPVYLVGWALRAPVLARTGFGQKELDVGNPRIEATIKQNKNKIKELRLRYLINVQIGKVEQPEAIRCVIECSRVNTRIHPVP